ncbi:signal transducer and activator of transcription B [Patella vulgata]|uniref:signal transducer and activator of transcription B n=1 Tax=Patella vulgata TaxID=6465 RepID=UPI0021804C9C|nr:signal transducer and activator of transcription B [Patella vulgata]XP_050399814.1 signal transducer and activator of transcription B [Patella vulgata]
MSDSADEDLNAPPLKKARYEWQVKGSRGHHKRTSEKSHENGKSSPNNESDLTLDSVPKENQDLSNGHGVLLREDECTPEPLPISNTIENTELILDTVTKFVNGQTKKIVQDKLNLQNLIKDKYSDDSDNCQPHTQTYAPCDAQNVGEISTDTDLIPSENGYQLNRNVSETNSEASNINNNLTTTNANRPPQSLDYITRWQSQQKAKAIVDNAINMTLEEMGLTPNLDQNLPILERLHVEDESISEAIRHRGLYPQDNEGDSLQGTITPLLQQLTQVSDTVFADRLNSMRLFITIRQTNRNSDDDTDTPLEWTDELAIPTLQARSESSINATTPSDNSTNMPNPNQSFQLSLNSNQTVANSNDSTLNQSDSNNETYDAHSYEESSDPLSVQSEDNSTDFVNVDNVVNSTAADNTSSQQSVEDKTRDTDELGMDDSDVMNFAVNAAISAKGLALKNE